MVTSKFEVLHPLCGICALFGAMHHDRGRNATATREARGMPELAGHLMRRSIGSLSRSRECCGGCRRTPLAGERLHEIDSGSVLCELCFAELPEERRLAVRSERVGAGERRLAVVPKAA